MDIKKFPNLINVFSDPGFIANIDIECVEKRTQTLTKSSEIWRQSAWLAFFLWNAI